MGVGTENLLTDGIDLDAVARLIDSPVLQSAPELAAQSRIEKEREEPEERLQRILGR